MNKKEAEQRLDRYVQRGSEAGQQLVKAVRATTIRPLKVFTKDMRFSVSDTNRGDNPRYFVKLDNEEEIELKLHSHALSRMRQEVDLSASTVKTMVDGPDWDRQNLEMLLNSKFRNKVFRQRGGGLPRFINLTVGDEVRGFVGRGFKRHLRSGPLLSSFVHTCTVYGAQPVEAFSSDLRVTLRAVLPTVFEPHPGEYIALGVSFSNSDFGAGAFRLDLTVMSLRNGNSMPLKTLNGSGRGESHAGGKGDDDVEDSTELSEDTVAKLIFAKQGEVKDLVTAALSPSKVNENLDLIYTAMKNRVSWYQLERFLRGKANQQELEYIQSLLKASAKSEELPDVAYDSEGLAVMDAWFASNLIAHVAEKSNDPDKKEVLQDAAGKFLLG